MEMTWRYVAGFFDADGCIRIKYIRNNRKYPRLQFTNTNLEVLEQIKKFLKTGHIYSRKNSKNSKTCYDLLIMKHKAVERIAERLIPETIVKKQNLIDVLTAIKTQKWVFNMGAYYRMKPQKKPDIKMVKRLIEEAWSLLDFCNEIIEDHEQPLKMRATFARIKAKVLNDLNKILYQAGITASESDVTELMRKAKELLEQPENDEDNKDNEKDAEA